MKKLCNKCEVEKIIDEFWNNRFHKDWKDSNCRKCENKRKQEYKKRNIEKIRKDWVKYYYKTRERQLKQCKIRRENNKEYEKQRRLEYEKKFPEKKLARTRLYQMRKRKQTPSWVKAHHTTFFWKLAKVMEDIFNESFHVDHRISIYNWWEHSPFNLHVITAKENLSKHRNSYTI